MDIGARVGNRNSITFAGIDQQVVISQNLLMRLPAGKELPVIRSNDEIE